MKITNLSEQQDYVRKQSQKISRLADIGYYLNSLIYNENINIVLALNYDEINIPESRYKQLFDDIEKYKTLLTNSGELK